MKLVFNILLLTFVASDAVNCTKETQYDQCPPWFIYNTTTNQCECYSDPRIERIIKCTAEGAFLRFGYCTTYDEEQGLFVSRCNYFQAKRHMTTKNNFLRLPDNISDLNDYMCGPMNRKGKACSECIDGYGISIFSLVPVCSNCKEAWYGVPLYLFLEFVPITIFYFIILLFRINVTTAPMVAFVFYCQIGVSTLYTIRNRYIFDDGIELNYIAIVTTFYGFWNLDFFRYILPPFCVSPNIKTFHLTYLFYISAFYPLCLTAIIAICINLHSRNNRPIVWLWIRINRYIFKHITKRRDPNNTMIDVLATFFLLSYAKLLFITVRTVATTSTFNLDNTTLSRSYHVSIDPSVRYFSREHIQFVIPSLFVFLFTIIPLTLLLALYPIRVFRLLLFKCGCSGRLITALNIFVDKFYSSYRDGLDGRRDMRGFISMFFVLRLLQLIASQLGVFIIIAILYICCVLIVTLVRPYKKPNMNIIDALILTNLALIAILADKRIGQDNPKLLTILYQVSISALIPLPLIALVGFVIYKMIIYLKAKYKFRKQIQLFGRKKKKTQVCVTQENLEHNDDFQLPDRMIHPEHYVGRSLTHATQREIIN